MSPGNGFPLLPKCQGKVTAFIKNKCWREDATFVFTAGTLILGQRYGNVFISSLWSDGCQWMVVFDGRGVLRIQREASWGRGAGGRARWPRLDGVGRRVLALSLPRISKFTVHRCAGGGPWGVSWFPIGQGGFCSWWWPADWVGRGRTCGRRPPLCLLIGARGQPQFLHRYPRGSQPGKGQPRQRGHWRLLVTRAPSALHSGTGTSDSPGSFHSWA